MTRAPPFEDVREGIVTGCVTIALPPQILFVLLSIQLKLPPSFIPVHKCGKRDRENIVRRVNEMIPLAVIRDRREDGDETFYGAMKLDLVIYAIDYQLLSCIKQPTRNKFKVLNIRCLRLTLGTFSVPQGSKAPPPVRHLLLFPLL